MENKNKIFIFLVIGLLIATLSMNGVSAKTINIGDASSFNQTGLSLSQQIQAIINSAAVGDTINFLGDFYENLTLVINKKLNIVSNVGTTIKNSDPTNHLNTIFLVNGSSAAGTNISGFDLNNSRNNGNGISVNNTKNVKIAKNNISANNVAVDINNSTTTISTNNISNSNKGIYIKNNSTNNIIEKNTITRNEEGILIDRSDNTNIKNNSIKNNKENGIRARNTQKTVIEYNEISNNGRSGINVNNNEYTKITNNNIQKNVFAGILTENAARNITIAKNKIYNGNKYGICLDSTDNNGQIIKSNTIYGNDYGMYWGPNYIDTKKKDVSSNSITKNNVREIDAKESKYDTINIGANWYGANTNSFVNLCPKIGAPLITAELVKTGNGQYSLLFKYGNEVMKDLPPMSVLLLVGGERKWVTVEGGQFTFNFTKDDHGKNMRLFVGNEELSSLISFLINTNPGKPIGGNNNNNIGGNGQNNNGDGPGLGNNGPGGGNTGGENSNSIFKAEGSSGASGKITGATASSQKAKEISILDDNFLKMDDTRFLTTLIIVILFGAIIVGYALKKKDKKGFI